MNTQSAGPAIVLSPTEPLHSKSTDSRFPFATAYAGFRVGLLAILLLPTWLLVALGTTVIANAIQFMVNMVISFFVFRWAINKHVLPYVMLATDDLGVYDKRVSFKNRFLVGVIAYWAMTVVTMALLDPITEPFARNLGLVGFSFKFLFDVLINYFPFIIAVKKIVLKPYRAKRVMPLLGLVVLLGISITVAFDLGAVRQEWAFHNHVYCEVLRPGMTQAEVTTALGEYGLWHQIKTENMNSMAQVPKTSRPS